MTHFTCLEDAKKDFEKKFREKTKNKWEERDNFVAHPSKYTLIEVQGEAEDQEAVVKVKGGDRGRGLPAWHYTLKYWPPSLASAWALSKALPCSPYGHPAQLLLPCRRSLCRWTEAQ